MIKEHIKAIRALFSKHNINGYIIPSNDEYMSEYTPHYAKRLEYISGFTGSNGIVVILEETSIFFTDGRYLDQSKYQLDPNIFQIFDIKSLPDFKWEKYININNLVGYDPKLFTNLKLKSFSNINLQSIDDNLIDKIWNNQPSKPSSKIYIYPVEFAGQSYEDKIALCRKTLVKHKAEGMIISLADSICWLLNLRASDIEYAPLMLGLVILTHDNLYLFVDSNRMDTQTINQRPEITMLQEEQFPEILKAITGKILVDENSSSNFIMNLLADRNIEKINDPCQLLKACKNDIEIKYAITSHIKDGVAICESLAHISGLQKTRLEMLSEYDIGLLVTEYRSKQDGFVMNSFPPICGFKENSAIIHYFATKDKAKKLSGSGLLLIDSGGQYMGATTDITRTISIGQPTNEQKKRYTQVLKGHIALARIKFPSITTGSNIDVLARQYLWQDCKDYPHGTGHGVGSFLSVHEGPQNINQHSNIILQVGMIISNEPGYYLSGEFGIRIENLVYVKKSDAYDFLEFENLTLVPFAKELIDNALLNSDELDYIKKYYQTIRSKIYPLLSPEAKLWLSNQLAIVI